MHDQDWKRWSARLQELSPGHRRALMAQLHELDERQQLRAQIDQAGESPGGSPHCAA